MSESGIIVTRRDWKSSLMSADFPPETHKLAIGLLVNCKG
jgi:hypothetical protein